jgi:hypothetical protein
MIAYTTVLCYLIHDYCQWAPRRKDGLTRVHTCQWDQDELLMLLHKGASKIYICDSNHQ